MTSATRLKCRNSLSTCSATPKLAEGAAGFVQLPSRLSRSQALRGNNPHGPAYTIAEKQLYLIHYSETALDLTSCVGGDDPKRPGFYLIRINRYEAGNAGVSREGG